VPSAEVVDLDLIFPERCNRLAHTPINRRKCTLPDASPATMVLPSGDMAQA